MAEVTGSTGPASFNREPLWWIASGQMIIQAIFALLSSFHVEITSSQQAAITGLFIVLGTAWGRSKVFAPVNKEGQPIMPVTPDQHAIIAAQMGATDTGNMTGTSPAPQIIHTESEMPHPKKNGLTQDELIHLMHEREKWMKEGEPPPHGEGQAKVP